MPVSAEEKSNPICDTDIWIKVCRLNNLNIIYNSHKKIFITDASRQELKNKLNDNPDIFACGYKNYQSEVKSGNVKTLRLNNELIFSDGERAHIQSLFVQFGIKYNATKEEFSGRPKNLGEKVAVIYAAILGIAIILSDDSDTYEFLIKNFKYIPAKNLPRLLEEYGYSSREIYQVINSLRTSKDEAAVSTDNNRRKKLLSYKSRVS